MIIEIKFQSIKNDTIWFEKGINLINELLMPASYLFAAVSIPLQCLFNFIFREPLFFHWSWRQASRYL